MAELELEVTDRNDSGKGFARKLRQGGKIPAIVYGGHLEAARISVDQKNLSDMIRKSEHGVRSIFLLKMAGGDQSRHAMIKDVQMDPITRKPRHIDFVRVVMDEVIRVTIPIHVTGIPKGVKSEGGVIDFQLRELHVECLPGSIPDTIDLDVSGLDVHQFLRISDLPIPEGVKVLDDEDRVVVGVTLPRAEAAPAEVEGEATAAEPEVIKRGKTEEEES